MNDKMSIGEHISFTRRRRKNIFDGVTLEGRFWGVQRRGGKILQHLEVHNTVMDAAKNDIWEVYFRSGTQKLITAWAMGLISAASYTTGIAAANTLASHAGWIEYTGYTQTNRPLWNPAAAASRAIANTTGCTFTFNSTGTLKGIFIASNIAKSSTSGILYSAGTFSSEQDVVPDDEISLIYGTNFGA